MTDPADRYVQGYPDLALWDATDGFDALTHFQSHGGPVEGRAIPPDAPSSIYWSDRVVAELHPEVGRLWHLGVNATCLWWASLHLGEELAAAGEIGSLPRVFEAVPDPALRRAMVAATADQARLRLWEGDLTPRLRWADPAAFDLAAIVAAAGPRAGVVVRVHGGAEPGAWAAGARVVTDAELRDIGGFMPTGPVEAIVMAALRPRIVHVIGPRATLAGLIAAERRIYVHVADRATLMHVPCTDPDAAGFIVADPRGARTLQRHAGIEPERILVIGAPVLSPPDGAADLDCVRPLTPGRLALPDGARFDPAAGAPFAATHLQSHVADDHALLAAVAAGIPVVSWPGGAVSDLLGADGALYAEGDAAAAAVARLRDDPALRAAIAGAAMTRLRAAMTPARLAADIAALHRPETPR